MLFFYPIIGHRYICEGMQGSIECPGGKNISIYPQSVLYGRKQPGTEV